MHILIPKQGLNVLNVRPSRKPGVQKSMGPQRVRHDLSNWMTNLSWQSIIPLKKQVLLSFALRIISRDHYALLQQEKRTESSHPKEWQPLLTLKIYFLFGTVAQAPKTALQFSLESKLNNLTSLVKGIWFKIHG